MRQLSTLLMILILANVASAGTLQCFSNFVSVKDGVRYPLGSPDFDKPFLSVDTDDKVLDSLQGISNDLTDKKVGGKVTVKIKSEQKLYKLGAGEKPVLASYRVTVSHTYSGYSSQAAVISDAIPVVEGNKIGSGRIGLILTSNKANLAEAVVSCQIIE